MNFDTIALVLLGLIVLTFCGGMLWINLRYYRSTDKLLEKRAWAKRQREAMLNDWAKDL